MSTAERIPAPDSSPEKASWVVQLSEDDIGAVVSNYLHGRGVELQKLQAEIKYQCIIELTTDSVGPVHIGKNKGRSGMVVTFIPLETGT